MLPGPAQQHDPVRVVVVDDSAVYRHGIVRALHRDPRFTVAGFFEDGDVPAIAAVPCDVLLLDHRLETTTGLQVVRDLRALGHDVPAVLLSATLAPDVARRARDLGLLDALDKALSRAAICDALHAAVRTAARPDHPSGTVAPPTGTS